MNLIEQNLQQASQLINQGAYKPAEQLLANAALRNHPDRLLLLGYIRLKQCQFGKSIELFQQAVSQQPEEAEYLAHLGLAQYMQGEIAHGLKTMEEARNLDSQHINSRLYLGEALLKLNMLTEAMGLFNEVLALDPYHLKAWFGKVHALIRLGLLDQASQELEKLGPLAEHQPELYLAYARLFMEQGNMDAALEAIEAGQRLAPEHMELLRAQGQIMDQWGRKEEALRIYRRILKKNPYDLYVIYRMMRMGAREVPQLAHRLRELLRKNPDLSPQVKKSLLFNLGSAEESLGHHRKAMEYFLQAGRYHHQESGHEKTAAYYQQIRDIFSAETLRQLGGYSQSEASPIFIVGLPRSGSTLVESMLATHQDIHAIGESQLIPQLSRYGGELLQPSREFPEWVPHLERGKWTGLAHYYLDKALRLSSREGHRIVDKNLGNAVYIGLIRLLFPNARILHCVRNPLDVATSCLSIDFAGHFPWTYNMEDFITHYRLHETLMQHWHQVLPGFMLDLRYEDMVNAPEETSRKVFDFIGLEWDESVLAFSRKKRRVATASVNQVRQGIYTSSQQRWKRYGDLIQPLIDAFPEWVNTND